MTALDKAFGDVRCFIDLTFEGVGDPRDALARATDMFREATVSDQAEPDDMLDALYSVASGIYIVSGGNSRRAAVAMAACAMLRVAITRGGDDDA